MKFMSLDITKTFPSEVNIYMISLYFNVERTSLVALSPFNFWLVHACFGSISETMEARIRGFIKCASKNIQRVFPVTLHSKVGRQPHGCAGLILIVTIFWCWLEFLSGLYFLIGYDRKLKAIAAVNNC